jgi:hypothetical protein
VSAVYDSIGRGYARQRRPDPRIAAHVTAALGEARSVLNVGAGAGSYEPHDRRVVAVEPSAVMLAQRPLSAAPRCARARRRCRSTTARSTRRWRSSRSTIGPTAHAGSPNARGSRGSVSCF